LIIDAGLKPIYVFGGHPMKIVARATRDYAPQESAQKWLDDFYRKGHSDASITDEGRDEAVRKMKNACKITPEIISMVIN
jgi:hypothetical protein